MFLTLRKFFSKNLQNNSCAQLTLMMQTAKAHAVALQALKSEILFTKLRQKRDIHGKISQSFSLPNNIEFHPLHLTVKIREHADCAARHFDRCSRFCTLAKSVLVELQNERVLSWKFRICLLSLWPRASVDRRAGWQGPGRGEAAAVRDSYSARVVVHEPSKSSHWLKTIFPIILQLREFEESLSALTVLLQRKLCEQLKENSKRLQQSSYNLL